MPDSHCCPHQDVCSATPAHEHFRAVASFSGLAALRAATINHRTVGLANLQTLSVSCEAAARLHDELTRRGVESVVLVTCNRTELYWRARLPGDEASVGHALAAALQVPETAVWVLATRLSGEAAATHLFRVCCGLESLVLGEAEILGQVRAALEACPGAGPFLEGVIKAALRTGRQARAETQIGAGAVSVASTGVQWLAQMLPLAGRRVLVVGAGDTGRKAARHLRALGVRELVIANRTLANAEAMAGPLGATAVSLDALRRELRLADGVVCAATSPEWLIGAKDLARAMEGRSGRPLFIVDLAMPAGVAPVDVPGLERIDLRALEHLSEAHRRRREAEIPKVDALIARELGWLHAWARHQALRPLVSDLRRKVEAIRRAELARATEELQQSTDTAVLERLSRRLLERVLGIPLATLEAGDLPLDATHAEYLRRLFALDAEAPRCA